MNPSYRTSPYKQRDSLNTCQSSKLQNSRATYLSPSNDNNKPTIVDAKIYSLNPCKFIKNSPIKTNELLPPKAGPFHRKRSNSRESSFRDKSSENISNYLHEKQDDNKGSRVRTESLSKMTQLRKKMSTQIAEKQKWKQITQVNQEKLVKMSNQLTNMKQHNKHIQDQLERVEQTLKQKQKQFVSLHQVNQTLNKTIKNQISQLNALKIKDTEIESLNKEIGSLNADKQSLSKSINTLKAENQKKNFSHLQEENIQKSETILRLQRQIDRLKSELRQKTVNIKLLQQNLRQTQRVLYQKQSDLKKITINLSFMGRKTAMSIDDVRCRKDLQIKVIRDRCQRMSKDIKDLKESKVKMQEQKKKHQRPKDIARRVRSSKHLCCTSQSEQFTFQLSSQT